MYSTRRAASRQQKQTQQLLKGQEFDDVKEIYRLNHNITERLRRNRDRLRLLLDLEA